MNSSTDCFKKEFSAKTNTSCYLPWVHHFTKVSNLSSKHCTDAELKAQFNKDASAAASTAFTQCIETGGNSCDFSGDTIL